MKNNKISESVLNRSVLKLITQKNRQVVIGGAVGHDCSVIDAGDKYILTSTECALTGERLAPYFAVIRAVNNIAACGGTPVAASAAFILPEEYDEKALKELTRMVDKACGECGIQLAGGHTEVSGNASSDMVTITVTGMCMKNELMSLRNASSGMAVIAAGWIAIEESAYLVDEHRDELLKRLPLPYVSKMDNIAGHACTIPASRIAIENGAAAMHDVAQKGIFAALWELSVGSRCGLNIDLRAIPVRQETIEFCEIMGINPYEAASAGCMLVITPQSEKILEAFSAADIPAAVIGCLTADNDKKIINGDEVRYLDKP